MSVNEGVSNPQRLDAQTLCKTWLFFSPIDPSLTETCRGSAARRQDDLTHMRGVWAISHA